MNAELRISFDEIKQALFDYAEKKISASYYAVHAAPNPDAVLNWSIYDLRRVDVDLHNRGDITEITGATITYTITEKTNDEN